ncbi:MAG: hypothetical protein PHV34_16215 [Verrucomicrobiae bacterium]|nr:hypothetical protein [Verrucomicrobiae bacterium]
MNDKKGLNEAERGLCNGGDVARSPGKGMMSVKVWAVYAFFKFRHEFLRARMDFFQDRALRLQLKFQLSLARYHGLNARKFGGRLPPLDGMWPR